LKTFDINNTAVVPYIIAERVTQDHYQQDLLVDRAERHYRDDATWRGQFNKARDSRDFLEMFMNHWLLGVKN
jgi:hypothetical protein